MQLQLTKVLQIMKIKIVLKAILLVKIVESVMEFQSPSLQTASLTKEIRPSMTLITHQNNNVRRTTMNALKMSENKTKLKRRNSLSLRKGELDLLVEEMVAMVAGKYSKTILMMANFRTPLVALEEESYQALVVV